MGYLILKRQEQLITNPAPNSPHLTLLYRDRSILDDACLLLLHHVRRQTSIHKEDKRKIKQLLKHFVADLFHHTRMDLSDEEDEASPDEQDGRRSPSDNVGNGGRKKNGNGRRGNGGSKSGTTKKDLEDESTSNPTTKESSDQPSATCSTASVWSELTKQKKLSTAQESQESRRTIAKRELKLLLSDARAHELTEVGRTSLRDKVNREYLSEMSKDDGGTTADQPTKTKTRASRRSFSQHAAAEATTSQTVESLTATGTPLPPRVITTPSADEDEAYTLFFANNNWYVFLRLHQILCERLSKIYEKAVALLMEETKEDQKNSAAQKLKLRPKNEIELSNYYPHFLEMIRNLLDGNMEPSTYEDTLREMFGIHAYIAYTMDKVVNNAVRQLQGIMSDDTSQKCLEVFHQAGKRSGNGGFYQTMSQRVVAENWYQTQLEKVCGEDPCVKILIFKKQCRMTMELLESDISVEIDLDQKIKYSNYVTKFLKPDSTIPESIMAALGANPVFLARNVRKWKKKNLLEWQSDNARRGRGQGRLSVIKLEQMDIDLPEERVDVPMEASGVPGEEVNVKSEPNFDEGPQSQESEALGSVRDNVNINITLVEIADPALRGQASGTNTGGDDHLVMLEKSQKERTVEFLMQENLQCQFNLSSFRMVYLTNSEDCIYLKGAMQRARKTHKKLSMKLSAKFRQWHQKWLTENVPDALTSICDEFLMDKSNVVSPRKTSRTSVSRADKPPYRKYHKYALQKE